MYVAIEFGLYLNYLFYHIWKSEKETWDCFLERNSLCRKNQTKKYRKLSLLDEYKAFRRLDYSVNNLSSYSKQILEYFKTNKNENDFWLK